MAKKNKARNNTLTQSQKIVLTVILIINISLMFTNWFGGIGSIVESGTSILFHPLTIIFILMLLWGIWHEFKININRKLIILGILGILFMEIYIFLTWHLLGNINYFSIVVSVELSKIYFYLGVLNTLVLLITSISFLKRYN